MASGDGGSYLIKQTWVLPYAAVGKPRMTQRDKWAKREIVVNYHAWKDLVRLTMRDWPAAKDTWLVEIEARYKPPELWSQRKKRSLYGTPKRTKPDADNVAKAVMDTLWQNDEAVGDLLVRRRWWHETETVITIWVDEGGADGRQEEARKRLGQRSGESAEDVLGGDGVGQAASQPIQVAQEKE
jgi:Holliday junction resolvase RusA-like endonuclease